MKDLDEEVELGGLGEDYPKPVLVEDLGMMYPTEDSKQKRRFGIYKCGFCGNNFKAIVHKIKNKSTKSCGCYQKRRASETHKTHRLRSTRLYDIWANLKRRVSNPKDKKYSDYGGRGITMCDEWLDIQNFYDWAMSNGYSDELSLDRIDNDGGYSPENCRWTTITIQNRNQRIRKDNKSGYKGVSYNKKEGKFISGITISNKGVYLGRFKTAEEGAIAYNNYIIENNLEGFILNEIPEEGYKDGKNLLKK